MRVAEQEVLCVLHVKTICSCAHALSSDFPDKRRDKDMKTCTCMHTYLMHACLRAQPPRAPVGTGLTYLHSSITTQTADTSVSITP
jgi:hypothetical protein